MRVAATKSMHFELLRRRRLCAPDTASKAHHSMYHFGTRYHDIRCCSQFPDQ
ncbi:hypothetical protein FA13DRAFT_1725669 [Coprinellus micaceus]|uniref:Uncharacterized protein n=1 Tax=Coprinellus micaceus TaxID=71717 RepID=A0A4Y7TV39_COPMI|nr:hypothetical protein FA13DRAFT_1725669 [Coprinellus micaceus]